VRANHSQPKTLRKHLGHGFTLPAEGMRTAIVGGGLGVYPLLFLARESRGRNSSFLGFRGKAQAVFTEDFARYGRVQGCTEDGSLGSRGYVTAVLEESLKSEGVDIICACGPLPMLRAVHQLALRYEIPCQVSMEERMACGIGACLGCACETADGEMEHVCSCGPVFDSRRLAW
jgi:dihydroorotate dehydrogenase electron transfer subunit